MWNESKDKPRILIVDDVETNRFTLRDIIADMGCQPILTENGEQALKIVERFPLSLIISDVAMPVMDGYEMCTRIKENPNTRDIPIIFISAFDDPKDIVKGFELKGEDYVTKPFIPEVVKARVRVHLQVVESNRKMQEMNRKLQTSVGEQMKQNEAEKQNTLYALLRVLRENPMYDENYMNRLSYNCRMLAAALQLSNTYGDVVSDSYIDTLEIAAPLCDLGKVAIHTSILERYPEVTPEEEKEYQRHVLVGGNILADIRKNSSYNDFLDMAIEIAKFHHESWDGSGYPEGLKGEEIPLAAQIVAVVSAFLKRTRNAQEQPEQVEQALEEIGKMAGTRFNPEIFDVFTKIARQLK